MRFLPIRSSCAKLFLLSLMHFAVDGLCAYLIFTKLYPNNPKNGIVVFLAYNILAFITQSPVGMLIDKYNRPKLFLSISMLAMSLGYIFGSVWPISVTCIGISNSLFHVAGGKYLTDKSGNDIGQLGVFVSTGAIGLVLGQRYTALNVLPYILFALFIVCGMVVILSEDGETLPYAERYEDIKNESLALVAVLAVVFVRSFVGKVVTPDFILEGHMFLVISVATALGKAAGGICAKVFGVKPTTYVSMVIAALCLTIGASNPYTFVLGVFAFNFTMPITLYFANILLKGREGFAFGTLAASLVPGYLIAMYFAYSIPMRVCTAVLCLASMLIIVTIYRKIKYDHCSTIDYNS